MSTGDQINGVSDDILTENPVTKTENDTLKVASVNDIKTKTKLVKNVRLKRAKHGKDSTSRLTLTTEYACSSPTSPYSEYESSSFCLKPNRLADLPPTDHELNALTAYVNRMFSDQEDATHLNCHLLKWIDESSFLSAIHLNLARLVATRLSKNAHQIDKLEEIQTFYIIIAEFLHKCNLQNTLCTFIAELTPIMGKSYHFMALKDKLLKTGNDRNCLDQQDLEYLYKSIPIHSEMTNVTDLGKVYRKFPIVTLLRLLFLFYDTTAEYLGDELLAYAKYKQNAAKLMKDIELKLQAVSYFYDHLKDNFPDGGKASETDETKLFNDFIKLFNSLEKMNCKNLEEFAKFMDTLGLSKQEIQKAMEQLNKIADYHSVTKTTAGNINKSQRIKSHNNCKFCGRQKITYSTFGHSYSVPDLKSFDIKESDSNEFSTYSIEMIESSTQRSQDSDRKNTSTQFSEALSGTYVKSMKSCNAEMIEVGIENNLKNIFVEINKVQENIKEIKETLLKFNQIPEKSGTLCTEVNSAGQLDSSNQSGSVMEKIFAEIDSLRRILINGIKFNIDQNQINQSEITGNQLVEEANIKLSKENHELRLINSRLTKRIQNLTEQLSDLKCISVDNNNTQIKTAPPKCQTVPNMQISSKLCQHYRQDLQKLKLQLSSLSEQNKNALGDYELRMKTRYQRPCDPEQWRF